MENESDQLVSVNIQYFSVNNDAGNGDPNLLSELKTKSFQSYEALFTYESDLQTLLLDCAAPRISFFGCFIKCF